MDIKIRDFVCRAVGRPVVDHNDPVDMSQGCLNDLANCQDFIVGGNERSCQRHVRKVPFGCLRLDIRRRVIALPDTRKNTPERYDVPRF